MVEFLVYLFVFLFGIVFGSFYNVVIYRLPIDISVAKGRSFCPNCKHSLKAIDLVPVLSQLLLKNKCRYCGQKNLTEISVCRTCNRGTVCDKLYSVRSNNPVYHVCNLLFHFAHYNDD